MTGNTFKQQQPLAYRIISNAFKRNRLAHAYLFVGEKGTPKVEAAYLIAQTLLCDNKKDGFACGECEKCQRVAHGNYADLIYVDGNTKSIKKEDILKIREQFSKTGLEESGKKIYILDGIENATTTALNSLLKFLEEPEEDVIAILTCESKDRILSTIVSRTQKVVFYKNNAQEIKETLEKTMDEKQAYILSHLSIHAKEAMEYYESDEYQHAFYLFEKYLEYCEKGSLMGKIFLQKEGFTKSKRNDKLVFQMFLDMMMLLCRDVYRKDKETLIRLWGNSAKIMLQLNTDKIITLTIKTKDKITRSVNIPLLVDQFLYEWEV